MEREKEKLPPLPEGCSVTTTVDAQRDASTKSLVSIKASQRELNYCVVRLSLKHSVDQRKYSDIIN